MLDDETEELLPGRLPPWCDAAGAGFRQLVRAAAGAAQAATLARGAGRAAEDSHREGGPTPTARRSGGACGGRRPDGRRDHDGSPCRDRTSERAAAPAVIL